MGINIALSLVVLGIVLTIGYGIYLLIGAFTKRPPKEPKVPKHKHDWSMWEKYERNFTRTHLVTGESHDAGCELWQRRRCTECGFWQEEPV